MVTDYDMPTKYFGMVIIPIEFEVDEYEEYLKDFWYVDYCNNCKDLDIMDSKEVPCHHPWYCWHDNGEVQELEYQLGCLNETERTRGYLTPPEKELLFKLRDKKYRLVQEKLREYRKENR